MCNTAISCTEQVTRPAHKQKFTPKGSSKQMDIKPHSETAGHIGNITFQVFQEFPNLTQLNLFTSIDNSTHLYQLRSNIAGTFSFLLVTIVQNTFLLFSS